MLFGRLVAWRAGVLAGSRGEAGLPVELGARALHRTSERWNSGGVAWVWGFFPLRTEENEILCS